MGQRALRQKKMPSPVPNYAVQLVYEGSTITSRLYHIMSQQLHRKAITDYIKKKSVWTDRIFLQVNWDAHEMAFNQLTHSNQIMVAKLIHNVVNTNIQNHKFYGKSPLCPCCHIKDETLPHLPSCASPSSTKYHDKALLELQNNLIAINTPQEVIKALIHGMLLWIASQQGEHTRPTALTAGSLRGPDVLLTMAFVEQFHSIGWYHLLMGRMSAKWGIAVALYNKVSHDSAIPMTWTAHAILQLWKFTRSLWTHRNTVVHGATDQEVAEKIRAEFTAKVTSLYAEYKANHNIILPKHKYVFTRHTLEKRLRLDIDSIQCWLRSVDDAKQAIIHHDTQCCLNSA
jgi:hypothetical protein